MPGPLDDVRVEGATGVGGVPPEGAPVENPIVARLQRLLQPDPRRPNDYVQDEWAIKLNTAIDGRFGGDASARSMVGESLKLCWDVVVGSEGGAPWPPLYHLAWSALKWVGRLFIRKRAAPGGAGASASSTSS